MNEVELLRQEVAQLRAEIDRVDEWAVGVFEALNDVLVPLLRGNQALARTLAPQWHKAANQFDAVAAESGQAQSFEETAERFEARKILYRRFDVLKLWPAQA